MMRMRRRRLVGAAVGTAVVVGTAGAVSPPSSSRSTQTRMVLHRTSKTQPISRVMADAQAQQQQAAPPPQPAAPAPAPAAAPAPAGSDLTSQLQQLSQLHNAGVLSDEEFAQAKQKLLAG